MAKFKIIKEHSINIVMYHYIRPVKNSPHPNLKALEFDDFKKQIDYFDNNFNIISGNEFLEIINSKKIPKKPTIVLTFDDGYIDHYEYVFPYLRKKKISGYFYPPKKVIENKIVLDVNKIHFLLEKEQDRQKILKEIDNNLFKKKNIRISNLDTKSIDLESKYDDKNTTLIKKLLQYFLPQDVRTFIIDELFKKIVGEDSESFAKKIYINSNHIKEMNSENMIFGCHGDNHIWLEFCTKEEQKKEIVESVNFFKKLKLNTSNISVSYPYGSYNHESIDLLNELDISFGLTTNVGNINSNNINNKFEFARFDTNEFKL